MNQGSDIFIAGRHSATGFDKRFIAISARPVKQIITFLSVVYFKLHVLYVLYSLFLSF